MKPIALLTDFGFSDHYAGVLNAVLVREAPGVQRIDLCHEIEPGDVWAASFLLRCAWDHLPSETVVLAVVDPGVGGTRRPLAARLGGRWLVAPDNGLATAPGPPDFAFSLAWGRMGMGRPSPTFHGRDLFAPAAARLARGDDPASLGSPLPVSDLVPCPIPEPTSSGGQWQATVVHVDRFGNVITNLPANRTSGDVAGPVSTGQRARRVSTYAEGHDGELLVLAGSTGLLEIAVRGGSAAKQTGLRRGDTVFFKDG